MEKAERPTRIVRKIGITGPESSGKTWMAQHLSTQFCDLWLPEYAREYLEGLHRPYTITDLNHISHEQLGREESMMKDALRILFCDTDILVLKIWYEHKFGEAPAFIHERLKADTYDLHLLMKPDIPYEQDPLRENPEKGEYFFNLFRDQLERYNLSYAIISGDLTERQKKAGVHIQQLLNSTPA
jgi:NadR type nicotinamide-nucleotide adenylyltransferase